MISTRVKHTHITLRHIFTGWLFFLDIYLSYQKVGENVTFINSRVNNWDMNVAFWRTFLTFWSNKSNCAVRNEGNNNTPLLLFKSVSFLCSTKIFSSFLNNTWCFCSLLKNVATGKVTKRIIYRATTLKEATIVLFSFFRPLVLPVKILMALRDEVKLALHTAAPLLRASKVKF